MTLGEQLITRILAFALGQQLDAQVQGKHPIERQRLGATARHRRSQRCRAIRRGYLLHDKTTQQAVGGLLG